MGIFIRENVIGGTFILYIVGEPLVSRRGKEGPC